MEDKTKRLNKNNYFMEMAILSSQRGTCLRMKVGCVLVYKNRIKSVGYNSSHPGTDHCEEVGCCLEKGHCIRTLHAEEAAVLNLEKRFHSGLEAYITHEPCLHCHKILAAAGVGKIYYLNNYGEFSKKEGDIKRSLNCTLIQIKKKGDRNGEI